MSIETTKETDTKMTDEDIKFKNSIIDILKSYHREYEKSPESPDVMHIISVVMDSCFRMQWMTLGALINSSGGTVTLDDIRQILDSNKSAVLDRIVERME